MTRQSTGQAAQRARVSHRRKFRGPAEGNLERPQFGISWQAMVKAKARRFERVKQLEVMYAEWAANAERKRAKREAAAKARGASTS